MKDEDKRNRAFLNTTLKQKTANTAGGVLMIEIRDDRDTELLIGLVMLCHPIHPSIFTCTAWLSDYPCDDITDRSRKSAYDLVT